MCTSKVLKATFFVLKVREIDLYTGVKFYPKQGGWHEIDLYTYIYSTRLCINCAEQGYICNEIKWAFQCFTYAILFYISAIFVHSFTYAICFYIHVYLLYSYEKETPMFGK